MTNIEKLEQHIVELQSQVAFQEDTIESLNAALSQQQDQISIMQRQLEILKAQQDEQGSAAPEGDAGQQQPPHY